MKKKYLYFLFPLMLIILYSCGTETYDKKVQKQKKNIQKLVSNYDVLYVYPKDHNFAENQYYKEPNSLLYYRVNKIGNLADSLTVSDAERGNIPVVIMFDSVKSLNAKDFAPGNYYQTGEPITFRYGNTDSYISTNVSSTAYYYMSQSLVIPLQKGLGTGAEVDIIVPFQNGSFYQLNYYEPLLFRGLRYTYFKQPEPLKETEIN